MRHPSRTTHHFMPDQRKHTPNSRKDNGYLGPRGGARHVGVVDPAVSATIQWAGWPVSATGRSAARSHGMATMSSGPALAVR